jgi:hypothetical protein
LREAVALALAKIRVEVRDEIGIDFILTARFKGAGS